MTRLISTIKSPRDLRALKQADLPRVADEIREEMLDTISKTGGHLASSLGAVELTIAIHYAFNTPEDMVLWDVGHQTYAHKMLTGRLEDFPTIRQLGGISGFPNKDESPEYDIFTCGHSSTSISTALGLVLARDLEKKENKVVVVIGDASLAGGMAFEALNNAGHMKKDLIIILNDNERSISQSVGALSRYLNRIMTAPTYNKIRKDVEKVLMRIPRFGFRAYRAARKLEEGLKNLLVPGMLFEELGFRYFGPIDGHDMAQLITVFKNTRDLKEPILIHVMTKKGKGYRFAEDDPGEFHGTGPFNRKTGEKISSGAAKSYTEVFNETVADLAAHDGRIVGITAAMVDGTGLNKFASLFPERFFDVGISEEHAIGLSAGLARGGLRPIVAVYSTFLQRGYDQIIHDVCLQDLPVVFCLDRAGIVGEDGPTHHGIFDIAYLRHIPNLTVMAPKDPDELKGMLEFALRSDGPVAIRYPRGSGRSLTKTRPEILLGKAEILKEGNDLAIISIGCMAGTALDTAALLSENRIEAMVINARFVKPLDSELFKKVLSSIKRVVTIEDGIGEGGFGSAILEFIEKEGLGGIRVKRMSLPSKFIEHGRRSELFLKYNLTPGAICDVIINKVMK